MVTTQILISAGEASGEMYAARLAAALRERTGANIFGLGGPHMCDAGVELIANSHEVSVVGISEVVRRLPSVWRVFNRVAREAKRRKPALAILVDFPDFNLRLARKLKKQGVRCVYFISPQVWAWRKGRVRAMKKLIERMICIFPFEEEFYRKAGVAVEFAGHPLAGEVKPSMKRDEFAATQEMDPERAVVALLPGSRASEIRHNLPGMLEACAILARERKLQFLLAAATDVPDEQMRALIRKSDVPIRIVRGATYDVLAAARCAIVASGTATVETALLGTPMVVVYRVSPATAFVARRLIHVPYFAMVNLIAGRRIVPELIQENFTPERVAVEALDLLESKSAREEMQAGLALVRQKLGPPGAIERAAESITKLL
jgi:lipid-A-disaccharide synthase